VIRDGRAARAPAGSSTLPHHPGVDRSFSVDEIYVLCQPRPEAMWKGYPLHEAHQAGIGPPMRDRDVAT